MSRKVWARPLTNHLSVFRQGRTIPPRLAVARDVDFNPHMYPEPRRSNRRFPCQARFFGAAATTIRGEVTDVSPTGMCLATSTELPRGRELHLEFELPTGAVEAVGEVRWVKKPNEEGVRDIGIRFVRISAPSAKVIEDATRDRTFTSSVMQSYVFR